MGGVDAAARSGPPAPVHQDVVGIDWSGRVSWFVHFASASASALGLVVLIGWELDVETLQSVSRGLPKMVPNTAAGFLLAGASLWLLRHERPARMPAIRLGRLGGALVMLLGVLTLVEYVSGVDLGFDRVLLRGHLDFPSPFPGRISPNTALSFTLLGAALALLPVEVRRGRRPSEPLAVLAAFLAFIAFTAYVFGDGYFYGFPPLLPYTGMALHTSVMLLLLGVAVLAARPGRGRAAVLFGPTPGGMLLRHLLPVVVAVPLLTGRLFLLGEERGLYEFEVAFALVSSMVTSSLAVLLGVSAIRLNQVDRTRRRAEEAQVWLATIVESSDDAILGTARDGTVLSFNQGAERLYGYRAEEVVGQPVSLFVPPERAHELLELFGKLRSGERVAHLETVRRCKDGSMVDVDVTLSPVTHADGAIVGISAIARDISQRKAMEAALARSLEAERGLRAQIEAVSKASEAVSEALATLPPSDVRALLQTVVLQAQSITYADFAALGLGDAPERPFDPWVMTGVPEAQMAVIGRTPRPVGTLGLSACEGRVVRAPDVRATREFRGFPPGHPEMASFLAVPIRFHGRDMGNLYLANRPGRPVFTEDDQRAVELLADRVAAAMETARLYRAGELKTRWLQAVIDQMPEGVILLDAGGSVLQCNETALRFSCGDTGPRDRRGNPMIVDMRRANGEPLPWDEIPIVRALTTGETVTGAELLLRRTDGAYVPVLANASAVRTGDTIDGAVIVFQDITPLKELERLREEWISVVAHDLRQPMGVIALSAQILARGAASLPEGERKMLERIGPAVDRLNRMIEDLLDASRLEAKRLTLERREVDLTALLAEIVERAAGITAGHPVRLDVDAAASLVWADPGRVEQVVVNLLSNAVKYGDAGAEITVRLTVMGEHAHVAVTNRGPGLTAQEIPVLFARFVRTRSVEGRKVRGIGLGLYIVKGLVEAHGGRVWVESTPGETTTFHVTLPLASANGRPDAAA